MRMVTRSVPAIQMKTLLIGLLVKSLWRALS